MKAQDFAEYVAALDRRNVQRKGRHLKPLTLRAKAYRTAMCGTLLGVDNIEDLAHSLSTREGVEKLVAAAHEGRAPATARMLLLAAREFAQHHGSDAFAKDDLPTGSASPVVEVFTAKEVETLLTGARAQDLRLWALLTFLADTGRRIGEALSLEWAWFNLRADPPHVSLPVTKSGRQQYVVLGTRLTEEVFTGVNVAALQTQRFRRISRDPMVHPFPWSYEAILKRFHELQRRLGMEPRGFHIFRHTRATEMLSKGVPIHAVSALLGHANVATTDRVYNHATSLAYANYVD